MIHWLSNGLVTVSPQDQNRIDVLYKCPFMTFFKGSPRPTFGFAGWRSFMGCPVLPKFPDNIPLRRGWGQVCYPKRQYKKRHSKRFRSNTSYIMIDNIVRDNKFMINSAIFFVEYNGKEKALFLLSVRTHIPHHNRIMKQYLNINN